MPSPFPDLPIITPPTDNQRLSTGEKYGGLFQLGVVGLVALVALIGWFVWGLAASASMWTDIYALHDDKRPEPERVLAAERLAKDSRVNQRQYWDMLLRPQLPARARYVLAEALTSEATAADPAIYARSVAYSEGFPNWLRMLLARPMAYAADAGVAFPDEPLGVLRVSSDPFLKVWALYVLAVQRGGNPQALAELEAEAKAAAPTAKVAALLVAALHEPGSGRSAKLDEATRRLRTDAPEAAALWKE